MQRRLHLKKMVFTAVLSAMSFVLSTFVYFPSMAPFQHFMNVLAAVFVGPYYGFLSALLTGLMRMMCGRSIQAVVGAIFGAFLSGLLYQKSKKLYMAVIGEVIGTGFISAMVAYPLMKFIYGMDLTSPFYYIPFYAPSSILGAILAVVVLWILKRNGLLDRFVSNLNS